MDNSFTRSRRSVNIDKAGEDLRPHFAAVARAGFMDDVAEGEYGDDMRPKISFLSDYDFTIEVMGESMLPKYKEGDVLACRIANDRFNPPIGKVCVIDSKNGAAVKEISGITENTIICHSLNPEPRFRDYEVEFSDIHKIAIVIGALRLVE